MPQLRQNIVTGEWVVIAPERAKRPNDYVTQDSVRHQSRTGCVFCDSQEPYKNRIKKYDTQHIFLTSNKYPAFIEQSDVASPRSYKVENDFYRARPSIGGHDIVVVRDHDTCLPEFNEIIWQEMFWTFKKRYVDFDKNNKNVYTMAIYNHGSNAGASVEHAHAQIFSSNVIPNIVSRELHHAEHYFEHNGTCVFCDIIKHEKREQLRIIDENKYFIAFTVFAARFPFEIWIYPKKHQSRFENLTHIENIALSKCLKRVFFLLDEKLNDPPLNFFIHNIPNTITETQYFHWHIEIAPRLAKYGGFELGAGTIIDVVSPEKAAEFLNENKKENND